MTGPLHTEPEVRRAFESFAAKVIACVDERFGAEHHETAVNIAMEGMIAGAEALGYVVEGIEVRGGGDSDV